MKNREPRENPGQLNFDFEEGIEDAPLAERHDWKNLKTRLAERVAIAKGEHGVFNTFYSLLTEDEREKLRKIKEPSERRAFIVAKYSNALRPPE